MRAIGFPLMYRQGPGIIDSLGEITSGYGRTAMVVSDSFVRELLASRITESFHTAGIRPVFADFSGETSPGQIEQLVTTAKSEACEFVVGLGGGKSQDAAKGVKRELGIPVVIVPTIASNDAATSRLAITYTDDGRFIGPLVMDTNPDAVIVDSAIIAGAPVRFFISGIADALSTWFEAEQCRQSAVENFFGAGQTVTALSISRNCYDVIWNKAEQALADLRSGRLSPVVEDVIEANVLMSGIGFEGCGVAAAHAISQGFTLIESLHGNLHGEEVAVALLSQFVLEDRDKRFFDSMVQFYRRIGIPSSLRELGLERPTKEHFRIIAEYACREGSRIYNMNRSVSVDDVVGALKTVEELSKPYTGGE